MSFEAQWGGNTCADCGEDIRPGQEIELKGEHKGLRGGNEYVHVNPTCERVAELKANDPNW